MVTALFGFYLIKQVGELLEGSTISLFITCSMSYPGSLLEDLTQSQLSVSLNLSNAYMSSCSRNGVGMKEIEVLLCLRSTVIMATQCVMGTHG